MTICATSASAPTHAASGEYAGGTANTYAQVGRMAGYLLGKNPLEREKIYNDLKRALRKDDRMGIGSIDAATSTAWAWSFTSC